MNPNSLENNTDLRLRQLNAYYPSLSSYREMMTDVERNNFYKTIINDNCKDKVVLDLGAGVGLLSIMAINAGAKKVYSVDANPEACMVIEQIKQALNLENLEIINSASWDLELPEKVDIILHELFGPFLFDELCLISLGEVKKFLKEDGKFLPEEYGVDISIINTKKIESVKYLGDLSPIYDNFLQTGQTIVQDNLNYDEYTWVSFGPWNFSEDPNPEKIYENFGTFIGEKDGLWCRPFIKNKREKLYLSKKNELSHWGNSLLRFGGSIFLEDSSKMSIKFKINENLSSFDVKVDFS